MKSCPRCHLGQMLEEPVYRASRPQRGRGWTCMSCGETEEIYPELPAVNLQVRQGRPPKARRLGRGDGHSTGAASG